jgi:hypothetical protein
LIGLFQQSEIPYILKRGRLDKKVGDVRMLEKAAEVQSKYKHQMRLAVKLCKASEWANASKGYYQKASFYDHI